MKRALPPPQCAVNERHVDLRLTGMTCGGCENAVTPTLMKLAYKSESVTPAAIRSAIETLGYEVQP